MTDLVARLLNGLEHQRAGRRGEAETAYRAVLTAHPGEPHALHYLGLLALTAKRATEALDLLTQALAAQPEHDPLRIAYGRALLAAGRGDDATAHFTAMAQARPRAAEPRAALALTRLRCGEKEEAVAHAEAALRVDRTNPDAWFALGSALAQLRRPIEAAAALDQAVAWAPDHAEAHLNLGNALWDLDRLDDAERHLRRAITLDPALAEAHASLGFLLTGDGRLAAAVAACNEAIALRPDFAQAHWNLSFAHMLAGDYAPGWEEYEWRKRHDAFVRDLTALPGVEWRGGPIAGKTILVRAEQGLGDTIQFARFLPRLAALGANVVVACPAPLTRLLARLPGVAITSNADKLPTYDVWIDQMSLPRLFATRPNTIPSASGYLEADPARIAWWRAKLPPGMRVGVVWAGNAAHSNDARRSMPMAEMAPILDVPGLAIVSLQVGPNSREIERFGVADLSARLTDLAETAALIAALDIVVSVDSCVAHLAGALGVPAWIILPFAPDWRWIVGRNDSPWYDSVRLFRQARPGEWGGPVSAVADALAKAQAASLATSAGAMRTSFS